MKATKIGFIGGGNMASSIIGGLIATGHAPTDILVGEPAETQRDRLVSAHNVIALADNIAVAAQTDLLILAVKPAVVAAALPDIAEAVRVRRAVVVSIAAGITLDTLIAGLGADARVVRAMPNTPALLRAGITGATAGPGLSDSDRRLVTAVLGAVGEVRWFDDEAQIDVVTAVSGSGPAYFFLLMEALQTAARDEGLSAEDARALVLQTALGAARLALHSTEDVTTLRERVTSPGGTTERAVAVLETGKLPALVRQAVAAARQRAAELAS